MEQSFKFLKTLGITLAYLSLLACAQTPISLNSAATWLESQGDRVAVLTVNGAVVEMNGTAITVLTSGFQGDSLVACNNDFLGVNASGQIAYAVSSPASKFNVAVHHRPLCLNDGRIAVLNSEANALVLLDAELNELKRLAVTALPDTELVSVDMDGDSQEDIAFMSDPSNRYRHAVLGDDLEGITVTVVHNTLEPLASFTLTDPFVFEQRRVIPFKLENKQGLLATRSSDRSGAGVILLSLEEGALVVSAESASIGTGFRWLNLFAAKDGFAYAVRTPHIGGAFQRYSLADASLSIEPFHLGVTNHVIGARNLDLGVILPSSNDTDYFALPSQSLRTVELIGCDELCKVIQSFELESRLTTNLSYSQNDGQLFIIAADQSNKVYRWAFNP